jgi:hypothetical protein
VRGLRINNPKRIVDMMTNICSKVIKYTCMYIYKILHIRISKLGCRKLWLEPCSLGVCWLAPTERIHLLLTLAVVISETHNRVHFTLQESIETDSMHTDPY